MYVCKLGKSRQGCLELTRWRKAHQSCWTLNDLYIQYTTRISLDSIGTSTPPRPSQGFQTQIQSARLPQATPATINRTTHPAHRSRDHPDHRRRPTGRNEKKKKKKNQPSNSVDRSTSSHSGLYLPIASPPLKNRLVTLINTLSLPPHPPPLNIHQKSTPDPSVSKKNKSPHLGSLASDLWSSDDYHRLDPQAYRDHPDPFDSPAPPSPPTTLDRPDSDSLTTWISCLPRKKVDPPCQRRGDRRGEEGGHRTYLHHIHHS